MRDHEEDVLTVLNEFFLSTEDGFINGRADKEIAEFRKHQAVSAYGAFIRDNPTLKPFVNKEDNVLHYLDGSIDDYISTSRANDVQTMGTSSVLDAPLTINHNHNHNHINKRATSVACPPDVSQQVWDDWVTLRKTKKAPITKTVLNGAIVEAKKLGWTLEQFLIEWCNRSSQGLKAEWIVKPNLADNIRLTVARSNEPDPALLKIEADRKKAVPIPLEVLAKMAQLRKVNV
jgi:hypothetical protein